MNSIQFDRTFMLLCGLLWVCVSFPSLKFIIAGQWEVQSVERSTDEELSRNFTYLVTFDILSQTALGGDLFEVLPDKRKEVATYLRLDLSDHKPNSLIVANGNRNYVYRLFEINFHLSRNALMIGAGRFDDSTGQYFISVYPQGAAEVVIYEKGKVTTFNMTRVFPDGPWHSWMAKYFYFFPFTLVCFLLLLVPLPGQENTPSKLKPE
jgi:hypothetical protein